MFSSLKKDKLYDQLQFDHRQRQPLIPGRDAYFARPADVILYKMSDLTDEEPIAACVVVL